MSVTSEGFLRSWWALAGELQLVSRKEKHVGWLRSHSPRGGRTNWLEKKIVPLKEKVSY